MAHSKLKDSAGRWRATGTVPPTWGTGGHDYLFIQEAKAAGFTTIAAWVPGSDDPDNYPWEFLDDAGAMANFDLAAAACVSEYPDVDIWLFGNEREQFDMSSSDEGYQNWFTLENRAGQIWKGLGKQWAAGADQAIPQLLTTIQERRNYYYDTDPDYLCIHAYGNGGFTSRNVRDVRLAVEHKTGRSWELIFTEWAIDFENLTGYDTKAWVRDYRARDYIEHVARALRRERCYGCFFTMKEIVQEVGQLPQAGILLALSDTASAVNPPSMDPTDAFATTRRLCVEGPYTGNEWGARWQGIKEFARSTLLFPGYW